VLVLLLSGTASLRGNEPVISPPIVYWGDPVEGLQLGLYFDKVTYSDDEEIFAYLIITNVSHQAHELRGNWAGILPAVRFIVTGPDRLPPPLKSRFPDRAFGASTNMLAPHEARTSSYRLRWIFDIVDRGDYVVTAEMKLRRSDRPIQIMSENAMVWIAGGSPIYRLAKEEVLRKREEQQRSSTVFKQQFPPEQAERLHARRSSGEARMSGSQSATGSTSPSIIVPMPGVTPIAGGHPLSATQKIAIGIIAALLALLLAILWRASRRKRT